MSRARIRRLAVVIAWSAGLCCEGSSGEPPPGPPPVSVDAAINDPALIPGPQTPPTGQADLEPWLAAGHYKAWACETQIFPARLNGAHGRHRICSNQLLMDSPSGPYPVGAASVKELFETAANKENGWAVGLKVAPGTGPHTWYWYERTGRLATLRPVADGVGVPVCGPSCHLAAPRDQVFIRAP